MRLGKRSVSALIVALAATATGSAQPAPPALGRTMVGEVVEYVVSTGETFDTIGARLGVDPTAIARRNTRWVRASLAAGTKLTVDAHRTVPTALDRGLLINVAQKRLFLHGEDGSITVMPAGLGRSTWPTPLGQFQVIRKEVDPTWDVPLSIQEEMQRLGRPVVTRVPPGPQNPLGHLWIGLSLPNIGIHGTNAPSSVPGYTTHGCIRLSSEHISVLFDRVSIGDTGVVIHESALLTRYDGRVFAEVHPDAYGVRSDALQVLQAAADYLSIRDQVNWRLVTDVVRRSEGLAIDVTAAFRRAEDR
jgi:L,D-transpeptidase ErfK/SrfK